jgi:hypothetical protein
MNKIMKSVKDITKIVVPLLTLAILLSLLVGPANMLFLGDVPGNIISLIKELGSAGLAGLIALGVILHLLQGGWCSCE